MTDHDKLNDAAAPVTAPILAIETSTTVARVAVLDPNSGHRLAAAEAASERHSSNLLRLCVETTDRARVSIAGLGAIACGAGPGSFTGLRVGFAVAKGLAMPTEIPLVLVSSLEALAMDMQDGLRSSEETRSERAKAWLLPCLDAGKGQVFAALFQANNEGTVTLASEEWSLVPELLWGQLPPDELPVICAGPGATRYWGVLREGLGARGSLLDIAGPTADSVGRRALVKWRRGETADLGTAAPSYGRLPDITKPKPRPR